MRCFLLAVFCACYAVTGAATPTAVTAAATPTAVTATPTALTVEYLSNPRGVDVGAPRFSWFNVAPPPPNSARALTQTSYHIQVFAGSDNSTVWDSTEVASSSNWLVPYQGPPLTSATRYTWRVQTMLSNGVRLGWSDVAWFSTGLFGRWGNATWITGGDSRNLLRTDFTVSGPPDPQSALFVSGIGYHEVYVNGRQLGDHKLDSSWSDNAKRNYYSSHDLAPLLRSGSNAIGVIMGNGWWACDSKNPEGPTTQPGCVQHPPQLLLHARLGSGQTVVSDVMHWKTASGPITSNSLYNGEHYDARREQPGWASAGFDDSGWASATAASSPASSAPVVSSLFEPIRVVAVREPLTDSSPAPGVYVYDFGQNMAGLPRLSNVRCDNGTIITLRHAELLMHPPYGPADGNIYVGNLRGAKATDTYTCKGDPNGESYEPHFTQHGFRFIEVSGLDYPLAYDQLHAVELHSDVKQHSSVAFSEGVDLLNRLQKAVVWGSKSNLMSVPTDCPQRDERRGWMGDAGLTAELVMYNFGMGALLSHWLNLIEDDQLADGAVTNFVPSLGDNGDGAPNWQSAYPTIVWAMWHYYGDVQPVTQHYSSLLKYYAYFERGYNKTGIAKFQTGFGDWVPPPPAVQADGHLVGSFSYLHDLKMGAEFFAAAGYTADAEHCAMMFKKLSAEWHAAFYDRSKGYYMTGLQTEQALPLYLGIVPDDVKASVLNYTVDDIIRTHNMHTTSGIIGIKCILEALTNEGGSYSDLALDMVAHVNTYPSYGYMLQGSANPEPATTIWELWDSDVEGPGMNSRNHIMFGTVSSWLFKWLVGIKPATAGFASVSIAPTSVGHGNLTYSEALVATPFGDVKSTWYLILPVDGGTCGRVAEGSTLHLGCDGSTITAITFASFGTPTGDCSIGFVNGKCDASQTIAKVSAQCLGKAGCSIPATNDFFQDPCPDTAKTLAASITCAGPPFDVKKRLTHDVSIPVGATAQVAVPLAGASDTKPKTMADVLITESNAIVWQKGAFVAGVAGVSAASVQADSSAVVFNIASGSYSFTTTW